MACFVKTSFVKNDSRNKFQLNDLNEMNKSPKTLISVN